MKYETVEQYTEGLKENFAPLSVLEFLGLVKAMTFESYQLLNKIAANSKTMPKDSIVLQCFQLRVATAVQMFVLGVVEAHEMLNAIDDFNDFVATLQVPEATKEAERVSKALLDTANNLIKRRQEIVDIEKSIEEGFSNKKNYNDLSGGRVIKHHEVEDFMKRQIEKDEQESFEGEAENLKAGESKVDVLARTPDGAEIRRTAIKLPFELGSLVTTGGLSGRVVGYFPLDLIHGVDESTTLLVEVLSSKHAYEPFDTSTNDEPIAAMEEYDNNKSYCRLKVKEVRSLRS